MFARLRLVNVSPSDELPNDATNVGDGIRGKTAMGQASPFNPIAVVVEDNVLQREDVVALLEESEMDVIQCESAEGALRVLEKVGARVDDIRRHQPVRQDRRCGTRAFRHAALPKRPRDRHLWLRADQKPARRTDVHAEAMAPARPAARSRALKALTAASLARVSTSRSRFFRVRGIDAEGNVVLRRHSSAATFR
jgi:hypothetical protein